LTKKCLDAGFDVWLEKPPVATIQDHDDLIAYANKYGKQIAVCFQYLYSHIVQEMKANIISGRYGNIKRIRSIGAWERLDSYYSRSNWAGKLSVDGEWVLDGTVNNPLAHVLSNNLYLASMERWQMAEPTTVQAELYHAHDIESEDTSSLRVITTDGVEVVFQATLCADKVLQPITVVECENAIIEYNEFVQATITYPDGRKKEIVDDTEQRVYMIEQLVNAYENKKPYVASLEICRPFTLAVNGAFESSKLTHSIDAKYIHSFEHEDSIKTVVEGLDELMQKSHQQGQLFSEVGAPWAVKTKPFMLAKYTKFPSKELAENI
jgi:predicted dehydrogenase